MRSLAKQNYRSELRELDWDFTGSRGSDGFAGFHWYPARFVSQLPGILIGYFTEPGQRVLDPFSGSGTTLVEAKRLNRSGVGIDTNPVAVLMTMAKVAPFNSEGFGAYTASLTQAIDNLRNEPARALNDLIPSRVENAKWYHEDTLTELAAIWGGIHTAHQSVYKTVALSAFSSILRFACSQDKHWGWICDNVRPKRLIYRNAVALFTVKMREFAKYGASLDSSQQADLRTTLSFEVHTGRCSEVLKDFASESMDAVVTSPPYFGVTDYVRAQRLTLLWFDYSVDQLKQSESGARFKRRRRAALDEFIGEMRASFVQIARVLRNRSNAAIVVGESPHRLGYIEQLEKLLDEVGLTVEEVIPRTLPRQRSLSPQLETERILICRKREASWLSTSP